MTAQIEPLKYSAQFAEPWLARLELGYGLRNNTTIPTLRKHTGPLRVQKAFYPEGPAHLQHIIVHPPGGITNGDQLHIDVHVDTGAHVLLTSPGAAKWYGTTQSRSAEQQVLCHIAANAKLEWLPQETIFFNHAQAQLDSRYEVADQACLLAADVIALGRPAAQEIFSEGRIETSTRISYAGQLIFQERQQLVGGDRLLYSPIGWRGHTVSGNLIAVGAPIANALLDSMREMIHMHGWHPHVGITCLHERVLIVRYLGDHVEQAWHALRACWRMLRPVFIGSAPQDPRIWKT